MARITSVNVIVRDAGATTEFLTAMGVAFEATLTEWEPHHRTPAELAIESLELDSLAFARYWAGVPDDFAGTVINIGADDDDGVDTAFAAALERGATPLREPHDAFWGSRYAVVMAPGPAVVGIMGPQDLDRQGMPPPVDDFA